MACEKHQAVGQVVVEKSFELVAVLVLVDAVAFSHSIFEAASKYVTIFVVVSTLAVLAVHPKLAFVSFAVLFICEPTLTFALLHPIHVGALVDDNSIL